MTDGIFHRTTRQREVILEELRKLDSHPTADQLHSIVRVRLPRISLGTVYRNLELLARMGVIQKLKTNGRQIRYDSKSGQHHHIHCVRCERIEDLPDSITDSPREVSDRLDGWDILRQRVEFFGLCPDCMKRSKEE